ncbi:MAG TPA: O-antigen ligase family protein [Pseudobdellovibrionaceae bacterium]
MKIWAWILLLLVFGSKISFAFLGLPSQIHMLVFQHGLHPYLNIILNFLFGMPIVFYMLHHSQKLEGMTKPYRTLLVFLLILLFFETLSQFLFFDSHKGFYIWAAVISTFWMILLFGIFLPLLLEPLSAARLLSTWSINFVVLSLVLWLVRPDLTFKGGRFIGVFKHIPYMVTCASVGVIFTLGVVQMEKNRLRRFWQIFGIFLSLFALILTGTRSALAAVLMAVILSILRAPTPNLARRYFKYSAVLVMSVTLLLFGVKIMDYAKDIATGKKALLEREAQDGVASRMEEIERGWEYFQTSPWIGQGLLSKFSGKEELEVSSYNSFKDPHNIIASAGVVGGWPFIMWTVFFLLWLISMSVKAFISKDAVMSIFGVYALVQIPILIIYHWHLSLGGMADRFYWLVFGYLALSRMN